MPIVEFKEFEQYKPQGYKGVFVGGCVERGDGSSFRAKAHAHNEPYIKVGSSIVKDEHGNPKTWKHFGWICVRSAKRLYTRPGQPSNLMWHELCHILTPGHSHDDVWRAKAREFGVYIGKRYAKQRRTNMAKKGAVAEQAAPETKIAIESVEVKIDPILTVTKDPQAKKMGPAKKGGIWYKNHHTGVLYRIVTKPDLTIELAETVKPSKVAAENQRISSTIAKKAESKAKEPKKGKVAQPKGSQQGKTRVKEGNGESRAALMQRAKTLGIKYFRILSKAELQAVLSAKSKTEIEVITEAAKKRWQNCPFFQKKAKKG
jgi:hypothetical protein